MKIAKRLLEAGESATLAVQQAASALRAAGADVADLGLGEPDFPMAKPVVDGGIAALEAGHTKYTATAGIPELRDAIAAHYAERHAAPFSRESIAVTAGAKHALYNTFLATVDPGDEVVVLSPAWVSYMDQIRLAGGVPRMVRAEARNCFLPDPADVERAMGPRTVAIVVNSPCNPTGAVFPLATLEALVEIARARDAYVLFDETYDQFVYEGEHVSGARFHRELGDRLVLVNSFSKTYAMTGLRLGYVIGAPALVRAITTLQSHTTSNASSISQHAALAALRGPQDSVAEMLREYRKRAALVVEALGGVPGVELVAPAGAFYAFPSVEGVIASRALTGSVDLASRLLTEAHVAVVPGAAFEAEGFIRLSFATRTSRLMEALARLRAGLLGQGAR